MEDAASEDKKDGLLKLADKTLKDRFVWGVRDNLVQRDLCRISVANPSSTFVSMRRDVLEFFQDEDLMGQQAKVRELEVETARVGVSTENPS